MSFSSADSLTDLLPRLPYLLGVDLLQARTRLVPRHLALGCVRFPDAQERRRARLLGRWERPFDELLDGRPRRAHTAGGEVDHLTAQPVPDRAPEVLLDQP